MQITCNYIVIEGNIGAGKTSLSLRIAHEFNGHLILESFAENPFLPKFYSDPEKYSFPLELSFLASRYKQLKEDVCSRDIFRTFSIADYYFTKSLIFASATLEGDEYNLYRQIFHIIYASLPRPDIYVYLHLEPGRLLENIKKRGREYEMNISVSYLKKIQESYFKYFRQNPENRYVILDVNNLDFVSDHNDYDRIIETIFGRQYNPGLNTVIL